MKAALFVLLSAGTALANTPPGRVDGWTGPFKDMKAATGTNDPSQLPAMPDLPDPLIHPVQAASEWKDRLPMDALVAMIGPRKSSDWHLVTHTSAGWFVSPALGVESNHAHCSLDSTAVYNTRLAIVYQCTVGDTTSAYKMFAMLCGVDSTGRPGCGSVVMTAHNDVHRNIGNDTVHETVSCKPTFQDDVITLAAADPDDDPSVPVTYRRDLTPCVPTKFPLDAHAYPTTGAKSRRFDETGRWR